VNWESIYVNILENVDAVAKHYWVNSGSYWSLNLYTDSITTYEGSDY
jgi:hypothetical protein